MSTECKTNIEAQKNPLCMATISGIASCPECGAPMCPICQRHKVTQLSRVTGYIGNVAGFNEGKKQELKDRKRYNINKREVIK